MYNLDKFERYTIRLSHENIIEGIVNQIEEPIAIHVYLHPLLKKDVNYSNEDVIKELVKKLREMFYSDEVIL